MSGNVSNVVAASGSGVVTAAQLNAYVQGAATAATARAFVGIVGMQIQLAGVTAVGDGTGGLFYWSSGSYTDDNYSTLVPPAAAGQGAWARTAVALPAPHQITASTYPVAATDYGMVFNVSGTCTITLPTASGCSGRLLQIKTVAAQTVVSVSSNVVPLIGGGAGTAILAATAGKWATLQSDGANWIVMAGN